MQSPLLVRLLEALPGPFALRYLLLVLIMLVPIASWVAAALVEQVVEGVL